MPSAVAQSWVIDNRSAGAWSCRTKWEEADPGSGRQGAPCGAGWTVNPLMVEIYCIF